MLDEAWQASGQRLGVLVKYADDLVALCATREQAEEARELGHVRRAGCPICVHARAAEHSALGLSERASGPVRAGGPCCGQARAVNS